jgi:hypothetical protein
MTTYLRQEKTPEFVILSFALAFVGENHVIIMSQRVKFFSDNHI